MRLLNKGSVFSIDVITRTVRGIEYVAAEELTGLSSARLSLGPRQVTLAPESWVPGLTGLRTVDDVFVAVGSLGGVGHRKDVVPWLAVYASGLDWTTAVNTVAETRKIPSRPRFDVVVSLLGRRNYSRYHVEDAVGQALAGPLGADYLSRAGGKAGPAAAAHLTVRVFISGDTATFAVRVTDGPVHRRSYKQHSSRGTLHPPMAAALARLAAPAAGETMIDPFCGDGTILIETAMLAPEANIAGRDIDGSRVRNAYDNAVSADVSVALEGGDASRLAFADGSVDLIATNPPWSLAVRPSGQLARGLGPFWSEAARVLSTKGRMALIMDAGYDAPGVMRDLGWDVLLVQGVRLAGRLSQIVVCRPPGRRCWAIPAGIVAWRERTGSSPRPASTLPHSDHDLGGVKHGEH